MDPLPVHYYEFDEFRFDPKGRLLTREGNAVDLTPKALEVLLALIEAGGGAVSKKELIERVWPDSFVEEANLSYTIYKLRRVLAPDEKGKFIETLPKRGYRFAIDVRKIDRASEGHNAAPLAATSSPPSRNKNRRLFRIAALCVILAMLMTAALLWRLTSEPAATAGNRPASSMTVSQITTGGSYSCAAISPDGQYIAYFQTNDDGRDSLFIRRNGSTTDTDLLGPGDHTFGAVEFSHDSKYIFYLASSHTKNRWELYRISIGGGPPSLQMTVDDNMFTLSPDDMRVYYYRFDPKEKTTAMIEAPLDGGAVREIYSRPFAEMIFRGVPSISPDGTHIAFGADNNAPVPENGERRVGLFSLDLRTGEVIRLSDEVWRGIGLISWLHDGSGLLFAAARKPDGNQLYYLSIRGGQVRQVTKEYGIFGNFGASISDDGQTIAGDRSSVTSALWQMDASGNATSAIQITKGEADGVVGVAYAPDGDVVYSSRFRDDYDLWLLKDNNGRKEGRPLTADTYFDGEPAVSSTGEIAFVSDREGSYHLFLIRPDGTGLRQLTFGSSFDENPEFTSDGKWVLYSSKNNDSWRIRKIPSDGGESVEVTDFESLAPSVSPDGSLIACVRPSEGPGLGAVLTVVSAADGQVLKEFPVLGFEYHYSQPRWTRDGGSLIYQTSAKDPGNLWRQSLSGGEPVLTTNFRATPLQMRYFDYSRDWKHVIASRFEYKTDVVLIKNFDPESLR